MPTPPLVPGKSMSPSLDTVLPEAPHPTRAVQLLLQSAWESRQSSSSDEPFGGSSGSNAPLSAEDLVRHWWKQAEDSHRRSGLGSLNVQDKQAIALRICQIMREMDLRCKGHVDNEEWIHYTMLKHSDRDALQINSLLRENLRRHPQLLEDLQRMFKAADVAKSGRLSFHEVSEMYSQRLWHIHPNSELLSEAELRAGDPDEFAREIIQAMDVSGDQTISYAEFMSFCLGRRKQPVVLHMYDLSAGLGKSLVPILGEELEHIWHTGLVVYGREYFWASDTVHDVPGKTSFGTPTKVVDLGFTLWRQDELHDYIIAELQPIFHRETYDHISNNCNHFTDRLCTYLLGRQLPDEVLQQTHHLMKLTTIKLLRPFLQWYCRDNLGQGGSQREAVAKTSKWEPVGSDAQLSPGTIIGLHPLSQVDFPMILGVVCSPADGQPKRIMRDETVSDSIQSVSFCSCSHIKQTPDDEVWIRYFDISLSQSLQRCSGQVRVESVPRSRLSVAQLDNPGAESVYYAAMLMMNNDGSKVKTSTSGLFKKKGASSPLSIPAPSMIPSLSCEDEELEDFPDSMDTSPKTHKNGHGTLFSVMASPARSRNQCSSIDELVARGYDTQAASAALASMDWHIDEAAALLSGRERLRQAVTKNEAACPLRPRLGPSARPYPAVPDTGSQPFQEQLKPSIQCCKPADQPGKAKADEACELPDMLPDLPDMSDLPRSESSGGESCNIGDDGSLLGFDAKGAVVHECVTFMDAQHVEKDSAVVAEGDKPLNVPNVNDCVKETLDAEMALEPDETPEAEEVLDAEGQQRGALLLPDDEDEGGADSQSHDSKGVEIVPAKHTDEKLDETVKADSPGQTKNVERGDEAQKAALRL